MEANERILTISGWLPSSDFIIQDPPARRPIGICRVLISEGRNMEFVPHAADRSSYRFGDAKISKLIVFLHGVGANAEQLAPLARKMCVANTACILMNAHERFEGNSGQYQWYSLEGLNEETRVDRISAALGALSKRTESILKHEHLTAKSLSIVGFSQGATLTLALAASGHPFANAVALSGRSPRTALTSLPHSPRILVSHGESDIVVPLEETLSAVKCLKEAGFDVSLLIAKGAGHSISNEQIKAARRFLLHSY